MGKFTNLAELVKAVELLSELRGDEATEFHLEREPNSDKVRLVFKRLTVTPLTNYVTPDALMNYVNERLEKLKR